MTRYSLTHNTGRGLITSDARTGVIAEIARLIVG